MERVLVPTAEAKDLMEQGKKLDRALERRLTKVHEAAHAVMMTTVRGYECDYITMDAGLDYNAATKPRCVEDSGASPDNADIIDLAGLCAEVRYCSPETKYAFMHVRNATSDLDSARDRLNGMNEVEWAKRLQPIAKMAVEHFWGAITAVADDLPDEGQTDGNRILQLVRQHMPRLVTPPELALRLKAEFVVVPASAAE
jgi:hypothetical protein